MVNRPPSKAGGARSNDGDGPRAAPQDGPARRASMRARTLQWSLRGLHGIDTGEQHFMDNYYDDVGETHPPPQHPQAGAPAVASVTGVLPSVTEDELEDNTAYEIFKRPATAQEGKRNRNRLWQAHQAPLRTGVVDGKKVVFELRTDVTKRPTTARQDRVRRRNEVFNSRKSPWDVRMRFWLMHVPLLRLTWMFLGAFILLNILFASFFYALDDHCCGKPTDSFANVFAFTVQTSTTIGYGGMSPEGLAADLLVIVLSFLSTLVNTFFAGLLFTKFVTPVINIQFSDVMTMCNVNGVPCLTVRMGNAEGHLNRLTEVNARLTCSYHIPYRDHLGKDHFFRQSEELRLLSSRQNGLLAPWELRHVLDETSPLFGLHFEEHPANKIFVINLSVDAVQNLTKSSVNVQTDYALEDVMIGHAFQDLQRPSEDPMLVVSDYSKMSDTAPSPVWYPSRTGVYETEEKVPPKTFGPY